MNQAKTALSALLLAVGATSTNAQWTLQPLWSIEPGQQFLPAPTGATAPFAGDNNQRGMGYNPVTGNILVTDRTGGTFIHIVNAATGLKTGTMNTTGITGGTFNLNLLRVADDGAIYAANLTTDAASASPGPLKIYRWANEGAAPQLVYQGDPSAGDASTTNRRFGDNFDVRGSGTGTQLLMGSRAGTVAAVFTTANGTDFTANKITNPDASVAGGMGIAVSFGNGNTFYGDATGAAVPRQYSFDIGAGTITTDVTYNVANIAYIGVDNVNSLFAGVILNTTPNRDSLVLYDISTGTAVLQDTETYPQDVANGNGVGSIEFANGNVYALNVNNGIMAFQVVPEPSTYALFGAGAAVLGLMARRRK